MYRDGINYSKINFYENTWHPYHTLVSMWTGGGTVGGIEVKMAVLCAWQSLIF